MFVDPDAAIQQFDIDYIHHGSNSQAMEARDQTVVHVQSPDNGTLGLVFEGEWDKLPYLGDANDIKGAMQALTSSSRATYQFFGRFLFL